MTPSSRNSQKRLEHKENQTKYRNMTIKPRSHVRVLYIERGLLTFTFFPHQFCLFCQGDEGRILGGRCYCPPYSLHSKCLCLVSKQRKTEEQRRMRLLLLGARKMEQMPKIQYERGGRGRGRRRRRTLPLPALLLTPLYVQSLTLVPCSWLQN